MEQLRNENGEKILHPSLPSPLLYCQSVPSVASLLDLPKIKLETQSPKCKNANMLFWLTFLVTREMNAAYVYLSTHNIGQPTIKIAVFFFVRSICDTRICSKANWNDIKHNSLIFILTKLHFSEMKLVTYIKMPYFFLCIRNIQGILHKIQFNKSPLPSPLHNYLYLKRESLENCIP